MSWTEWGVVTGDGEGEGAYFLAADGVNRVVSQLGKTAGVRGLLDKSGQELDFLAGSEGVGKRHGATPSGARGEGREVCRT